MNFYHVSFSRGQLKIQQMAFVLVAMMIFFSIALLFYFSIRYSSLEGSAEDLRAYETIQTIRKMSSTPEFSWTVEDCSSCIDLDKVMMLKEKDSYDGFWKNTALLKVERVYPKYSDVECTRNNYPECNSISLIDTNKDLEGYSAFVSLCRFEGSEEYNKCELGKITMAFETIP